MSPDAREPRRPADGVDATVADTFPASDPPTPDPHRPADDFDAAVADTFPASDPPSMTSPVVAAPAVDPAPAPAPGPRHVYRVVPRAELEDAFSADANRKGGRWTNRGTPAVYASLSPGGAVLEFLAHLEGDSPRDLVVVTATLPGTSIEVGDRLPPMWRERPYRDDVRAYGDAWVKSQRALALELPSVLCETEHNVLINPEHTDASQLKIRAVDPFHVDPRLRY